MLDDIKTIEQVALPSYKDQENFDFQLLLDKNLYTNLNSLHFAFALRIRKASNNNEAIEPNIINVNNLFTHWIKEISITKYGTNKELIPTTTPQKMYKYFDSMLKHLPKKSLEVIRKKKFLAKKQLY